MDVRWYSKWVLLAVAAVGLPACEVISADGYLEFNVVPFNYFDPDLGNQPVMSMTGSGPEFVFDQQMISGAEAPDLVVSVDIEGRMITLSMSSTYDENNTISGFEIRLDNLSFTERGMAIGDLVELEDDFPFGVEGTFTSESIDLNWDGGVFSEPFAFTARYEMELAQVIE